MLLESLEIGSSGLAKLRAGELSLFLRPAFWIALGREEERLAPGIELGEEEALDLLLAAQATEAEARGAALLGRAEQPRFLLRSKLLERGYPGRAVELALDRLEEEGFLSDRRYAEAWLRSRVARAIRPGAASRAEGPSSLLLSLRARSLAEGEAKAALAAVLDPETRAALLAASLRRLASSPRAAGGAGRGELAAALRELGWKGEELREALDDFEAGEAPGPGA